jgi:hypothetical protein
MKKRRGWKGGKRIRNNNRRGDMNKLYACRELSQ